ncbi:MAG TPA: hypothetical protein VN802_06045 [Stellaceae bacterium]|nr:hypothetical protein [Stellaceae bacterium]
MPLKHWWHSWLTRHWDDQDWNGWPGNALRIVYLTVAMLATLLVAPSILAVFLNSFALGMAVSIVVFGLYSWIVVGHYPEPRPEDM